MSKRLARVSLGLGALLVGLPAWGEVVLPEAVFTEQASVSVPSESLAKSGTFPNNAELVALDVSFANQASDYGQAVVSVLTSGGRSPTIDIQAQVNANSGGNPFSSKANGSAQIDYWFMVEGPDLGGRSIAVNAFAYISISGSATPGAYAYARASIEGLNIPGLGTPTALAYWGDPPIVTTSGSPNGFDEQYFGLRSAVPNQLYKITLKASGEAKADVTTVSELGVVSSAADFQVVVDPVFSFTNEEDAANYSFVFSENLIPEPSSLALLSMGGLALARRRR